MDAAEELVGGGLDRPQLVVELLAAGRPRLVLEPGFGLRAQVLERLVEGLDAVLEGQELGLDLLDRVALGHQLLDGVDPADGADGVDPVRAEVLALLADTTRARHEAELDVAAEVGLAELDPLPLEGG